MKIFWANSICSYISRIFVYFPIVLGLILSFDNLQFLISILICGLIASYLLYFCNFCWYFGFLKFTNEYLYTPNDFVPKITRLQYREKILYKDICAIEFKDSEGNSFGKPLWRANCVSYLEITTKNNCIHKIAIGKYSHKQWNKIEKEVLKKVPNVLIIKSANELIKFRKN